MSVSRYEIGPRKLVSIEAGVSFLVVALIFTRVTQMNRSRRFAESVHAPNMVPTALYVPYGRIFVTP